MALNKILAKEFLAFIHGKIRTRDLIETTDYRLIPVKHHVTERNRWILGKIGRKQTFIKYYRELDGSTYNISIKVKDKIGETDIFFFKDKKRIREIPIEIYRPAASTLKFQAARVSIDSDPKNAKIEINGKYTDKLTPETFMMTPGDRSIKLSLTGFKSQSIRIRVADGKAYEIFRKLKKLTGTTGA